MTMTDLDRLIAREDIKELKARYCRFVDQKQWNRLALLFTADTRFDGFGSAPTGSTVDQFIAGISQRLANVVSIHHCHSPEISITTADTARGLWPMVDYLQFPDDAPPREAPDSKGFVGWGYYEEEYRREAGTWKFCFLRLTRLRIDPLAKDHPAVRRGLLPPTLDWM